MLIVHVGLWRIGASLYWANEAKTGSLTPACEIGRSTEVRPRTAIYASGDAVRPNGVNSKFLSVH